MAAGGLLALGLLEAAQAVYPSDIFQCQEGAPAFKTELMTSCQYREITNAVISTWSALPSTGTEENSEQALWSACAMRMASHDFLDHKDGQGGADGCADLDQEDNSGLSQCVYDGRLGLSLVQAYQPFCQQVSLADFLIIASEAIMMATRRRVEGAAALTFKTTFKFGRETAQACPRTGAMLPDPKGNCNDVNRVYLQQLGLDGREASLLAGALCCYENPNAQECTNPNSDGGAFFHHVAETRENGDNWMLTFRNAWTKATEVGHLGELHALESCNLAEEEEVSGLLSFDCSAEEPHWERGWSEIKKGFCCKSSGIGCEEDFDCEAGVLKWQRGWSLSKKYHCCKKTAISCEDLFDCGSGTHNWQRGWSGLKKSYCCGSVGIGCENPLTL